jgi:hypothetical protein
MVNSSVCGTDNPGSIPGGYPIFKNVKPLIAAVFLLEKERAK